MNIDKAGEAFWSNQWKNSPLSPPIDVMLDDINYYPDKRAHLYIKKILSGFDTKGKSLLEIGCGNSAYLPFFAKEYGLNVSGLDYSEHGCEQASQILSREGVKGSIYCADFFSPPAQLLNSFDFVISMGVVEHFSDTAGILKIFSGFLKEDGILITTVPNFSGMRGYLQKKFNRAVYDIHVPLDKGHLKESILKGGLKIIDIRYSTSVAFRVELNDKDPLYKFQRLFVLTLCRIAKLTWLFENFTGSLPEKRFFSSDILSIAKKIN